MVDKIVQSKASLISASPTTTGGFANNHIMVNVARKSLGVKPLLRSPRLDMMAREHAECMARKQKIFHSVASMEELEHKLGAAVAGENVHRGSSIKQIQISVMDVEAMVVNIRDVAFTELGMGTAMGKDRQLYMCQLFC